VHIASAQPRAEEVERGLRGGGLLAALFRGGADQDEDESEAVSRPAAVAAAPAAPVRQPAQAPARPEAAPRTAPETIVAALPERNAPLPGVAPRPLIDVGAPARAALVPGLPVPPAAIAPAAEAEIALAAVPLPTRRPDYKPELRVASA
jgi:hypothetical protein